MKRLNQIFQALLGVVALMCAALIAVGRFAWRTIRKWWDVRSKHFRRFVTVGFVLFVVGFVAAEAYSIYEDEYGWRRCNDPHDRYVYNDKWLTDDVVVHTFSSTMKRVYDTRYKEYTTGIVNWVSDVSETDSLTVYALPHKRGFINAKDGKIVIDAMANHYTKAWVFSEGLAAVEQDGKIGFINARNEVVIPFKFTYSDEHDMYDLAFLFHDGYCVMTDAEGWLGVIDKKGDWVVAPQFDQVWAPQDGYRTVIKDGKYGLLDSSMKLIYDAIYESAYSFPEAGGFVLVKDGRMWQEDCEGRVVQPFMYESSDLLSYPVAYGDNIDYAYALSDYVTYTINNRYGIMNRVTGNPITLAIYDEVNMISPNLFEVYPSDAYGAYLIDTNGNVIGK